MMYRVICMKHGELVWHSAREYSSKGAAINLADKSAFQNNDGLVYEVISDEKFKEIQDKK